MLAMEKLGLHSLGYLGDLWGSNWRCSHGRTAHHGAHHSPELTLTTHVCQRVLLSFTHPMRVVPAV